MTEEVISGEAYTLQEVVDVSETVERPPSDTMARVVRGLVYLATFLVPLWFLPWTYDIVEFNKQVLLIGLAGIGLILFLVDIVKSGVFQYRPTKLYWAIAAVLVGGIVSIIFSVNKFASVFGSGGSRAMAFSSIAALAVLFFLAFNVIQDKGRVLKHVIQSSLTLCFLVALLLILGIHVFPGRYGVASFNTIGTLDALVVLAATVIPLFFVSPDSYTGWMRIVINGIRYIGFGMAIVLLVLVNWWAAWVVAFISLFAYMAFNVLAAHGHTRMAFFALPLTPIVIGVLCLLFNFNIASIKAKLPVEVAPTQRASYGVAWRSLKSHPLGMGLENFSVAYERFRTRGSVNNQFFQLRFTEASSEVANVVAEGGIPMMLMIVVAIAALLWYATIRVLKRFDGDAQSGTVWAVIVAFLVSAFFFPSTLTFLLLLTMSIVLGMLNYSGTSGDMRVVNLENSARFSFAGSIGFVVGLVVVVVSGYFFATQYRANALLAQAVVAGTGDTAVGLYVKSINSNIHDTRTYRLLSQNILAKMGADIQKAQKEKSAPPNFAAQIQNQVESAVNVSTRATDVDPSDSENWINRGYVYQNVIGLKQGADQLALSMYREAIVRNPNNPLAFYRLGNVYLSIADIVTREGGAAAKDKLNDALNNAGNNFKEAVSLYNNFGQALYNLAYIYDRGGQLPQAVKQFERLTATQPNDPSILFQLGLLYYRNNQKDNARLAWERAVQLFPNYSNARWYLSFAYEERGELDKALAQVKAIEQFNKDNTLVQQRLAQLEANTRTIPPEKVLDKKPL